MLVMVAVERFRMAKFGLAEQCARLSNQAEVKKWFAIRAQITFLFF